MARSLETFVILVTVIIHAQAFFKVKIARQDPTNLFNKIPLFNDEEVNLLLQYRPPDSVIALVEHHHFQFVISMQTRPYGKTMTLMGKQNIKQAYATPYTLTFPNQEQAKEFYIFLVNMRKANQGVKIYYHEHSVEKLSLLHGKKQWNIQVRAVENKFTMWCQSVDGLSKIYMIDIASGCAYARSDKTHKTLKLKVEDESHKRYYFRLEFRDQTQASRFSFDLEQIQMRFAKTKSTYTKSKSKKQKQYGSKNHNRKTKEQIVREKMLKKGYSKKIIEQAIAYVKTIFGVEHPNFEAEVHGIYIQLMQQEKSNHNKPKKSKQNKSKKPKPNLKAAVTVYMQANPKHKDVINAEKGDPTSRKKIIERVHRKLALQFHPDRPGGNVASQKILNSQKDQMLHGLKHAFVAHVVDQNYMQSEQDSIYDELMDYYALDMHDAGYDDGYFENVYSI